MLHPKIDAVKAPMSSTGRPPRIPMPKAASEVSNVSAELQAHMTNAVKALGQQIWRSMKSMHDQINHPIGYFSHATSHISNYSVVFRPRSHQAFAASDHGDGGGLCQVVRSLSVRTMYLGDRICPTYRCRVFQRMLQRSGAGGTD